jgi:hypothetical protein
MLSGDQATMPDLMGDHRYDQSRAFFDRYVCRMGVPVMILQKVTG